MIESRFRLNVLFQLLCLLVEILIVAVFVPHGVHRFDQHRMDVTGFVFGLAFLAVIFVIVALVAFFYTIEIGKSQLTVRAIFVISQIDIGSILYVQQFGEIVPMCVFGVDKGLAGKTVRYVLVVRPWVEFMARLKQRNQDIRFSKRNEKRIAAYLSKTRE